MLLRQVESSVVSPAEAMSDDDAFSWLESLAAKQGAKPEELLTKPEDRAENAPAWATQMEADTPQIIEQPAEVPVEPVVVTGEDLAWLQTIGSDESSDESTIGEQPIEENLFTPSPTESIFEEKPVDLGMVAGATMVGAASADEVAEWLQQLNADDQVTEEPVQPAQPVQPAPYTTEELPDWLKEEEPAELPTEELPDWLKVEVVEQLVTMEPVKTEWKPEEPLVVEEVPVLPVYEDTPVIPVYEDVPVIPVYEDIPEIPVIEAAQDVPVVVTAHQADSAIMDKVGAILMEPAPEKPVKVQSAEKDIALYENSKLELQRGNLIEAAQGYKKLIKRERCSKRSFSICAKPSTAIRWTWSFGKRLVMLTCAQIVCRMHWMPTPRQRNCCGNCSRCSEDIRKRGGYFVAPLFTRKLFQ